MKRFVFLILAIIMVSSTVIGGNMDKTEKKSDSLESALEEADRTFRSDDYSGSREQYLKVVERAESEGDNSILTEARAQVARTYLKDNDKKNGREWLDKAAGAADSSMPLGWSRYLGVKGRFEWKEDDLKKAAGTFKEMYEYCSGHKLHERAVDAAHMIAIVGTTEEQIEWGKKGIAEAEAGNISGWLGPLWNNLGWTYEHEGRYDEALEAYRKAREYHWMYGGEINKLAADWAVGHTLGLLGRCEEAGQWLRPALAWAERISADEWIGWASKDLGECQASLGNIDDAKVLLGQAVEMLGKAGMADWDPDEFGKLKSRLAELNE